MSSHHEDHHEYSAVGIFAGYMEYEYLSGSLPPDYPLPAIIYPDPIIDGWWEAFIQETEVVPSI